MSYVAYASWTIPKPQFDHVGALLYPANMYMMCCGMQQCEILDRVLGMFDKVLCKTFHGLVHLDATAWRLVLRLVKPSRHTQHATLRVQSYLH